MLLGAAWMTAFAPRGPACGHSGPRRRQSHRVRRRRRAAAIIAKVVAAGLDCPIGCAMPSRCRPRPVSSTHGRQRLPMRDYLQLVPQVLVEEHYAPGLDRRNTLMSAARGRRGVGAFNVGPAPARAGRPGRCRLGRRPCYTPRSARTRSATTAGSSGSPWRPSPSPGTRPRPAAPLTLNAAGSPELVMRRCGSASSLLCSDGSSFPYAVNVAATAGSSPDATPVRSGSKRRWGRSPARTACTRRGHAPTRRRRPARAATKVDALAVAVGTSHAMLPRMQRWTSTSYASSAAASPSRSCSAAPPARPTRPEASGRRGDHQGEHRDAPQQGVHRRGTRLP